MRLALLTTDSREHFKDYANPAPYFGTAPEALLEGLRMLPERVEVHVVSCLQEKPASSPTRLADNVFYHGLHVPKAGWMRTGYQGCIRAVRRKLREIKPDVVHGQGTERDCAISAALSGYPSVVTVHGVMRAICELTGGRPLSYYWFARQLETFALRRTSGVIAISPYVDALVAPLTPRTWFIPNALQSFFLAPADPKPRRAGPPRLVNVGVVSPRKRQVELLERLGELRNDVSFEITFVGKTNAGDPYAEQFAAQLQRGNANHGGFAHHEFLTNEEFLRLYDDADAMIHFSNEESFGLTFAEALARNLPLFASDVGAIRQIAEGIPACRIFGLDDFDGLMASVREWIGSAATWKPRETTPNRLIASRYHPKVIAARHLEVYETVVGSTARTS
jgi:glycosyltransferase involved in cell wall biosynthesis